MTSDIREQAAMAAREWKIPRSVEENCAFVAGYLIGYEAAKAEAFVCPGDTRTCPAFTRGECKGTEAEWNDESCEARWHDDD